MGGPGEDIKGLLERKRKRIPGPRGVTPVATKPGVKPPVTPGPLGMNDAAESLGQPKALPPLEIHLDLTELVELNVVVEHGRSGLIKKGQAPEGSRPCA